MAARGLCDDTHQSRSFLCGARMVGLGFFVRERCNSGMCVVLRQTGPHISVTFFASQEACHHVERQFLPFSFPISFLEQYSGGGGVWGWFEGTQAGAVLIRQPIGPTWR
jgi:hypothetical protein